MNLPAKPDTLLFNKVTIKGAKQAVQMFGPAQAAVARAVVDSVADGTIPRDKVDDYCVLVGVFIHWDAKDDKKIYDFNYRATKESISRALKGTPKADEVILRAKTEEHPFAGGAPPMVCTRWIDVMALNIPFPDVDLARSSSQGIADASGASRFATTSPMTLLPSRASQVGPA